MNHEELAREQLLREHERRICAKHPAFLIDRMWAVSERDAEADIEASVFHFDVLSPNERREANQHVIAAYGKDEANWPEHLGWREKPGDWFWQRTELLDVWLGSPRHIDLKARQLGVTTIACSLTGHTALYKPGSSSLHFRQKEADVIENIQLTWALMQSLPQHLWNGASVETPARGAEPSTNIRLSFKDGRMSRVRGMTSAADSGHGKRAALIVLDEFSRIDNASSIMKAVNSAAGQTGRVLIISTANGVSDAETGEGNRYHWIWVNAESQGYEKRFLPWNLHPERDQTWYETSPEVTGLKSYEKAEQYPSNEHEAFTLTNRVFFEPEDLMHYGEHVWKPKMRFDFDFDPIRRAALKKETDRGAIRVYKYPDPKYNYAIGADVATGRGIDYSAAYVINLSTMELVAEFHARIAADLYANQLHFLGRYYGTQSKCERDALIAIEIGGGFGEAVIIALRDGVAGRPRYARLYRHVLDARPTMDTSKAFGWPTNSKTRPKMLNQLEQAIRERTLPWVTSNLLQEMQTFVNHDHGPSPAAQSGSRDDCVMAASIALEMYHQRGHHPHKIKPRARPKQKPHWLPLGN